MGKAGKYAYNKTASSNNTKGKNNKNPATRKVTSVFVSGLPLDVTLEQVADYFKKCGILYEDPHTGSPNDVPFRSFYIEFWL